MDGMKMLAVCAREERYSARLAEYARNKNNCPFQVQAFSAVTTLTEYLKLRGADAVLLDEAYYRQEEWREYDGALCLLGNGIGPGEYPPRIFRYQSARDILNDVLAQCKPAAGKGERPSVCKRKLEVFGVYSPVGRCGKSLFTLALALELARHRRTLYLNLESWPGLEAKLIEAPEGSLSDLLYFLRQRRGLLPERLCGMAVTVDKLDLIPPVRAPADLTAVSVEDWQYLFETLRCGSGYEAVALDIGDSPQPVEKLLGMCSRVYVPTLLGERSRIKLSRFLDFVKANGRPELTPELVLLDLPQVKPAGTEETWAEQLLWGEMGDYVRRVLKGKGEKIYGTAHAKA